MRAPLYARPIVAKLAVIAGVVCVLWAFCGCGSGKTGVAGPSEPVVQVSTQLPALPAVPANRVFGYYAYAADGAGCGWSNWSLVYARSVDEAEQMAAAARACRQVLTFTPWRGETTSRKWDETWRENQEIIRVFERTGVLHSVYVADEPLAAGWMGADEIARRIGLVHAQGWKAMFTEQGGGVERPHPAVDYYGLDWYDAKPHVVRSALQRHPEINVLVVPAYRPGGDGDAQVWIEMAKQQRVGVAFWLWPSLSGWVGTVDMPEVQQEHRRLWSTW